MADETVVQLDGDLTIKEDIISINESIFGSSSLIFNGSLAQHLTSTSTQVNLPHVFVSHATLHIPSTLSIRGDVHLSSSLLIVNQPIVIEGELLFDENSLIEGKELINQDTGIYTHHLPLPAPQSFKIALSFSALQNLNDAEESNDNYSTNPQLSYTEALLGNNYSSIPSPPPKQYA